MNTKKIERLLNKETNVRMDGCAMLVLLRIVTDALANDEEIGPLLGSLALMNEGAKDLSTHGRMLMSASGYIANAARETFGEEYLAQIYGLNNNSGMPH